MELQARLERHLLQALQAQTETSQHPDLQAAAEAEPQRLRATSRARVVAMVAPTVTAEAEAEALPETEQGRRKLQAPVETALKVL